MRKKPLNLLWIESGYDNLICVKKAFKRQEIPVVFSKLSSLSEAQEHLLKASPDLIITDDVLPDGKGIELLYYGNNLFPAYPLIIMSEHIDEKSAVETIKAGAMDYVIKSGTILSEMPHIVQRVLREWRLHAEQQQTLESLRQSEERYRFLVENTIDGFFMARIPSGKILFLNKKICELFGYSYEEAMSFSMWKMISLKDHRLLQERIRNADIDIQSPPERLVYMAVRKDGSEFKAEVSVSAAVFQEKKVIQGVLRDITEQEVIQRQLRDAQKMEAIGTLAGGIAHEFNNIMQAVSGYTELLMFNPNIDESGQKKLRAIQQSTHRAAELTRQIMIFGRKIESEFREVDINQEARHAGKLLKKTLPQMIGIELAFEETPWPVRGDAAYLGQAIVNLGINARDAMPDGGCLTIKTRNMEADDAFFLKHSSLPPGRYVRISVSDTGHGIAPDIIDHIYEPFYTTRDISTHRGLGLAMVYGIVKDHGGHIICTSRIGKGSCFDIFLPVLKPKAAPMPAAKNGGMPEGDETILLVDDEELIREVGDELLSGFGYKVMTAPDAETALETYQLNRRTIDLVILDLVMPGMGGMRCLEEMLKIDSSVKILVSSGFSQEGFTKDALPQGVRGFVSKPYDIKQMLTSVRNVLDAQS